MICSSFCNPLISARTILAFSFILFDDIFGTEGILVRSGIRAGICGWSMTVLCVFLLFFCYGIRCTNTLHQLERQLTEFHKYYKYGMSLVLQILVSAKMRSAYYFYTLEIFGTKIYMSPDNSLS